MASAQPVNPDNIKPFAPPKPEIVANAAAPRDLEQRDDATKAINRDLSKAVGYVVAHERVGPWKRNERLTSNEVVDHFQGHEQTDEYIERLVSLGALVPVFD